MGSMESLVSNQAAVDAPGPSVAPDAQRAIEFLEHVFPGANRSAFYNMVEHVEWVHVRGGEFDDPPRRTSHVCVPRG